MVLPTSSWTSALFAGWNPPQRTSRYSRSSSWLLNIPAPPETSIARSTTRFAASTAWYFVGDELHRPERRRGRRRSTSPPRCARRAGSTPRARAPCRRSRAGSPGGTPSSDRRARPTCASRAVATASSSARSAIAGVDAGERALGPGEDPEHEQVGPGEPGRHDPGDVLVGHERAVEDRVVAAGRRACRACPRSPRSCSPWCRGA